MTARGIAAALCCLCAWGTAFSVGSRLFYLAALFLTLLLVYSLLSVLSARFTFSCHTELPEQRVLRGDQARVTVKYRCYALLPGAQARMTVRLAWEERECDTVKCFFGRRAVSFDTAARFAGSALCGVREVVFGDPFLFFRLRYQNGHTVRLLCLPRVYDIGALSPAAGREGTGVRPDTGENAAAPEDTRLWREGDALKRVHWKLSARSRELTVRRYETEVPRDTLIVTDFTAPSFRPDLPFSREAVCTALLETAVSAADRAASSGLPLCIPFPDGRVFTSERAFASGQLAEMLAGTEFGTEYDFSRLLRMMLRRSVRTGTVCVITSRLTAATADAVCMLRLSGPSVRVYLCAEPGDEEQYGMYIRQLEKQTVEVYYAAPV